MDDFLVPVKTTRSSVSDTQHGALPKDSDLKLESVTDVIQILKHEPDFASVERAVRFLSKADQVDIKIPSSTATPILHLLISDVLPNYWAQIFEDESTKKLAKATLRCLRSLPALGAIVARLRMFAAESGATGQEAGKDFLVSRTARLISLLEKLLAKDAFMRGVLTHIQESGVSETQKRLLWKELVAMVAGGKLVSTVSEAEDGVKLIGDYHGRSWIGVGREYGAWLGRNIGDFVRYMPEERMDNVCSQLVSKSLSLGYTGRTVRKHWSKLTVQMPFSLISSRRSDLAKKQEFHRLFKSCASSAHLRHALS
jgi:telomere length regulation protein